MSTPREPDPAAGGGGQLPGVPGETAGAGTAAVPVRPGGDSGDQPAGHDAEHQPAARPVLRVPGHPSDVYFSPVLPAALPGAQEGRLGGHEKAPDAHGPAYPAPLSTLSLGLEQLG